MASEFDPVMELMAIREGMLSEGRTGPAETVLAVIARHRALEAELADAHRARISDLSGPRQRRASDGRPPHRPPPAGRPSTPPAKRSSTPIVHPSSTPVQRTLDEQVDDRAARSSSASSDLQDLETATEGEDQDLRLDPISGADAARASAETRSSTPAKDAVDEDDSSAVDEEVDGPPDEVVDEDADAKLKRAMAGAWDGLGGAATSGAYRARMATIIPLVRSIAAAQGKDAEVVWAEAVARFKADPEARRKRLGLPVLCAQFEQWTYDAPEAPKRGPNGSGNGGPVGPAYAPMEPAPRLP